MAFSELHISTGSTLASLNCQGDLDERFVDDTDLQPMSPIRECTSDEDVKDDDNDQNRTSKSSF